MQALRKTEPSHGLTLTQADMPAPGPGEVLLRVHSAGVCGTDLHIAEWTRSYHFLTPALPVTIGHEFSGEIAALGEGAENLAPGLTVGQMVAVRPSVTCGRRAARPRGNLPGGPPPRGSDFHSPEESHTDLGDLPYLPGQLTPVWELLSERIQLA